MKKLLMTLVALIAMTVTANAQTVYVSTGDGAVAYHKSKSCSYLSNSKDVKSVSTAEAKKMGRHECTRCYGTAAAAKKTTATKAVKKTEGPARDEKGRFIKKADTEKKVAEKKTTTTAKKTTPARDEKGRFIKKADTEKKAAEKKVKTEKKAAEKKVKTEEKAAKKTTPARDEKGRFIKKADTEKKAVKKATPARDEKGRFIKKADTEKKTTAKKTKKAA